jgi:PP-loop superfamily ATP-utilizing enzyme
MGYKEIPAMFVDTGLEYPEIRQFVKTFDNVDIVKPQMNFKQVIQKYGYPIISKETAEVVYNAKRYLQKLAEQETILDRQTDRQTDRQHRLPYEQFYRKLTGTGEYSKDYGFDSVSQEQRQMDDALSSVANVRDIRDTLAKEITGAYP